jgi:hypothetical protein
METSEQVRKMIETLLKEIFLVTNERKIDETKA